MMQHLLVGFAQALTKKRKKILYIYIYSQYNMPRKLNKCMIELAYRKAKAVFTTIWLVY